MNHFAAALERKATADRIMSTFINLPETIRNGIDSTSSLYTDASSLHSEHVLTGDYLQIFIILCILCVFHVLKHSSVSWHPTLQPY